MSCPKCGDANSQAGLGDTSQCLTCGGLFDSTGKEVAVGIDATTRARIESQLAPRTTNLVGNLADLARLAPAAETKDEDAPKPKGSFRGR